jgi:hypothetical protein
MQTIPASLGGAGIFKRYSVKTLCGECIICAIIAQIDVAQFEVFAKPTPYPKYRPT